MHSILSHKRIVEHTPKIDWNSPKARKKNFKQKLKTNAIHVTHIQRTAQSSK